MSTDETPGHPTSPTPARRDLAMWVLLGSVLATVALITVVSMARTVFQITATAVPVSIPVSGPPRALIDFTLTNSAGQVVNRADFHGQWLIVNFVFSSCSLSCMQVNHRMAEIQKLVARQSDVRLISLTIDPRSDSPPVLAKFAARFQADTNRWLFLTGDKRVLYPLIEQSFLGPEDPSLRGLVPGGWSHIDHIVLVDPKGRVRDVFEGLRPNVSKEVVAALAALRRAAGRGGREP